MEHWGHAGTVLVHVAMGIALAACAGLRAFLPPFVVGVAGRLGLVELSASFGWLAETPALFAFGAAVVVEVLADKVPVVDHALDAVQTLVKPIAGGFVAATVVSEWAPLYVTVASIVVGASASTAVHFTKAHLRLVSTVSTAGVANPVLSVSEDGVALTGTVGAIALPLLGLLLLAIAAALAWWAIRRHRRPRPL